MKHLFLILFTSAFLFAQGCTNGNAEGKTKEKTSNETATKAEPAATANASTNNEGAAIHLTKAEFLEKVANYEKNPKEWVYLGDKPCIIDFYADWCRPCKIAGPILEELAKEYKGQIYVYKINTEEERELASVFGIQSIPAFLFCPKTGNPQMSAGIAQTPEDTKAMFKKVIDDFLLKTK